LVDIKNTYVSELPFFSGAVEYFSYDLCHRIETFKEHGKEDMNIPDMIFGFYNKCNKVYAAVSSIGFERREDINQVLERKINEIIKKVCEGSVKSTTGKKLSKSIAA